MKKRACYIILLAFCLCSALFARDEQGGDAAPRFAVKTNTLYWLTATPNISGEIRIDDIWTLGLQFSYNPFTFSNDKKWKHWMIRPEARRWFDRAFSGHFVGLHLHAGQFNVNHLDLPFGIGGDDFEKHRYEGPFYGGGISYGYRWNWNERWGIEAEIGLGYFGFEYDKFDCATCGELQDSGHEDFIGPTKAAVTLIYTLPE